jgi:tRNA(Ile)-lysidine synthase
MLNKIKKTIASHAMLSPGDHHLAAVSGGPDSVALLRILTLLAGEYGLCLTTAHLNHGLRAEADAEEAFVRRLSDELGISCICGKADIPSLNRRKQGSLEEVARRERYRFLFEAADRCGAVKIALGHHRDDQAETVLLHLIRGSGAEGLRGILPVREGRIIRPLLEVGRDQILEFLRRDQTAYMTDSSNADLRFLRNRIRNELLPELKARYNPRLVEGLARTAGIIRLEDDYLAGVVRQTLDNWGVRPGWEQVALPLSGFRLLHGALQARLIKGLLEEASSEKNGIGHRHVEAVLRLCRRAPGREAALDLPFGLRVTCGREFIELSREGGTPVRRGREVLRFEYGVTVPAAIPVPEIGRTVHLSWAAPPGPALMKERPEVAFLDYDCLEPPLTLRNRRPGDRVAPLGLEGSKKLKDYFIDGLVPRSLRDRIPLLADSRSIVWIGSGRISERVRVTEGTRRVVRLEIVPGLFEK